LGHHPPVRAPKLLVWSLLANLLLGLLAGVWLARKSGLTDRIGRARVTPTVARADHFRELARGGAKADVVVLGDSLTQRAEWWELLGRPVANRGIVDDTVALVRARLGDVVELRPRVLFLLVGVNDLFRGASPERLGAQHAALVREIRASLPGCRVIVESLLPLREEMLDRFSERLTNATISRANARLKDGARAAGAEWVDVGSGLADASGQLDARYTSDGLHLSGAGYRAWAEALRPYLP
jgi:lysophospholipase L1-like esterase